LAALDAVFQALRPNSSTVYCWYCELPLGAMVACLRCRYTALDNGEQRY